MIVTIADNVAVNGGAELSKANTVIVTLAGDNGAALMDSAPFWLRVKDKSEASNVKDGKPIPPVSCNVVCHGSSVVILNPPCVRNSKAAEAKAVNVIAAGAVRGCESLTFADAVINPAAAADNTAPYNPPSNIVICNVAPLFALMPPNKCAFSKA